uniref:Uncharacterized protein n=1 Tax=Arundo donax TaxID=35708 RepID=A0A0A9C2C4_ARUDO
MLHFIFGLFGIEPCLVKFNSRLYRILMEHFPKDSYLFVQSVEENNSYRT